MVRKKFGLLGSRKPLAAAGGDGAVDLLIRKGGTVPRTSAEKPPLFASLVRGRSSKQQQYHNKPEERRLVAEGSEISDDYDFSKQRQHRKPEEGRLVAEGSEVSDDYDDSIGESFAGRRAAAVRVRESSGMDIWTACQVGDVPYVAATVDRYPEFIHLEQRGRTPLFHACNHDHVAIAAMLLEAGATDPDRSCYQAATSPVLKNLLLQYKAVEDELQSSAAADDDDNEDDDDDVVNKSHASNNNGYSSPSFNWEVGSLPAKDDFPLFGSETQSHFSKPIETPLVAQEGRDEDEPSVASSSSDTKEEASSAGGDDASSNESPNEVPADEKKETHQVDDLNEKNFSHDEEEQQQEAKPSEHFEIVLQKKKKKRAWLPKKLHLSKKRSGSLEIVESHSGDGEAELYSRDIGASFDSMGSAAVGKSFESDDLKVEEKPAAAPESKAAALASVAATAGTSIATTAAVTEQDAAHIESVRKNSRWLALKSKMGRSSSKVPASPEKAEDSSANLEKASKDSLAEVSQWFFAKPNTKVAEDVSVAKHSISNLSNGGVEVRDKTATATRPVPKPVVQEEQDGDDASVESKKSKAISLVSKAGSNRSKASKLSAVSGASKRSGSSRAAKISAAATAASEMSKLSNEVTKTFPPLWMKTPSEVPSKTNALPIRRSRKDPNVRGCARSSLRTTFRMTTTTTNKGHRLDRMTD